MLVSKSLKFKDTTNNIVCVYVLPLVDIVC